MTSSVSADSSENKGFKAQFGEAKKAAFDKVGKVADAYPKAFGAILLIGSMAAIVSMGLGYKGPHTGSLGTIPTQINQALKLGSPIMGLSVGTLFIGGITAYFIEDKESKVRKCAVAVASVSAILLAYTAGSMFGSGMGDSILNPLGDHSKLLGLIPLPLPPEMSMMGLTTLVLTGAAGATILFDKLTKNSKHKAMYQDLLRLLIAGCGIALTVSIIFANIHGKSADPMMAFTSPVLAPSMAAAGMGVVIFAKALLSFNTKGTYQLLRDDERRGEERREIELQELRRERARRSSSVSDASGTSSTSYGDMPPLEDMSDLSDGEEKKGAESDDDSDWGAMD